MIDMVHCLKALADENRLRILMLLRERGLCVYELMGVLDLSQPLISSHLAVLREAGLVTSRREGRRMRYGLSPAAKTGGKVGIVKIVAESLAGEAVVRKDRKRLAACASFRDERGACDRQAVEQFRAREVRS